MTFTHDAANIAANMERDVAIRAIGKVLAESRYVTDDGLLVFRVFNADAPKPEWIFQAKGKAPTTITREDATARIEARLNSRCAA